MEILDKNYLNSGDLILFHTESSCVGKTIQYFTNSKFCHIGMVLKDPTFINKNLKGFYLLESSYEPQPDVTDGKIKYGVQIQLLDNIIEEYGCKNCYLRKIKFKNNIQFYKNKFKEVYDLVNNKPYDLNPIDWIQAECKLKNRINGENTKSFWCSSLMGFIFHKMGWMEKSEDWSLLSPNDWSYYQNKIKLINCELTKEEKL